MTSRILIAGGRQAYPFDELGKVIVKRSRRVLLGRRRLIQKAIDDAAAVSSSASQIHPEAVQVCRELAVTGIG